MSKLREDVRVVVLGAVAGLFSIGITLLVARVDTYYSYLALREETDYQYEGRVEDLWWVPASIWHLVLSIIAALLVHRYLTKHLRSPFLLWVVTGSTALLGWGLTWFLLVGLGCLMQGDLYPLERTIEVATSEKIFDIAKYVSTAFACSVLYGSVMKSGARQYAD